MLRPRAILQDRVGRKLGRADQFAKQHRQMPPLAGRSAAALGRFQKSRRSRLLAERAEQLMTLQIVSRIWLLGVLESTFRAAFTERSCAPIAKMRVRSILGSTIGATH